MKPRTLAILLALVAGLGAFIWFFERERPGTEERERLAKRVLDLERDEVARLELHAGDRVIALERTRKEGQDGAEQDQWRLRRPLDFPADYWQADGLVRTLAELERVRELAEYEPSDVGLDPPRGRVVIELEDGGRRELRIGAEVPGSENMIVALEGTASASVVPATLWESVSKDASEWRDRDLFAAERDEVRELLLEHAGARVRLERDASSGDFVVAEPFRDRAEDDAVNALLRELTGLRASEFVDAPPPLAELGLDPPRGRLVASLDEGEPVVVRWGDAREGSDWTWAAVGDLVVATTAALDEPFSRAPADWRSRAWSSLPVYDVDRVTVADAEGVLELARDEGSWRRGDETIEQGPVSDLLYAIDDAVAERIAAPVEPPAPGEPELTITLATVEDDGAGAEEGSSAGAREERLELFAHTADNLVPARVSGRDAILLLRRETRDEILAKLAAVRTAGSRDEETP